MKFPKVSSIAFLLLPVALVTACGGGGDPEAGAPAALSLSPSTITFTAPVGTAAGVCLGNGTARIFIYGGAAPYHIDNTEPDYVVVDTSEVSDRGGSFGITTNAICLTSGLINVVDKLNRIVTLTVSNSPTK